VSVIEDPQRRSGSSPAAGMLASQTAVGLAGQPLPSMTGDNSPYPIEFSRLLAGTTER
jgi:hypothetical protein